MHFVYDVTLSHGNNIVARITRPESLDDFRSTLLWHPILFDKGVPLAKVISENELPTMLLERLTGTDLQHVYLELSLTTRTLTARKIAAVQRTVATLRQANGSGYATSWHDPDLLPTWTDLLRA